MFAPNTVGGRIPYPPALTQSYSFLYIIKLRVRFFFDCAGAKKKLTKRNALLGTRKGDFWKNPPLNPPKTFRQLTPGAWFV